jgi:hypothetical protein
MLGTIILLNTVINSIMNTFYDWLNEHLHKYDNMRGDFEPLKRGDTVRVFHGFDNVTEAIIAARYGISGQLRPARKYSYEANTNPKGLFVTISEKTARDFALDGCVVEFIAKYEDLEPPVWVQGSYGTQGSYMPTFRSKVERLATKKRFENEIRNDQNQPEFIKFSDNPYMTKVLFDSSEYQALFTGNLNPDKIISFSERDNNWEKINLEEFLEKYKDIDLKSDKTYQNRNSMLKHEDKLFLPEDDFDADEFVKRLAEKVTKSAIRATSALKQITNQIIRSGNIAQEFIKIFHYYLYPKQYARALSWLLETYENDD